MKRYLSYLDVIAYIIVCGFVGFMSGLVVPSVYGLLMSLVVTVVLFVVVFGGER